MKENASSRIKQLMDERNLKQVDILEMLKPLSKETGITLGKSTLSQYVNGIQSPDQDRYYLLGKLFNVNEPWLMGYDVDKERLPDEERSKVNDIKDIYTQLNNKRQEKVYNFAEHQLQQQNSVRLYGGVAANPTELDYVDELHGEYVTDNVPNNADGALVVTGDSMEPEFKNGSIVFYKHQQNVENGQLAVVEIDGNGTTFKKVYFNYDEGAVILKSLNDQYEDRELSPERVRIIGLVIR